MEGEENWIEWSGGPCPVPLNTKVEVKYRNGLSGVYRASQLGICWRNDDNPYDVVAYQVLD